MSELNVNEAIDIASRNTFSTMFSRELQVVSTAKDIGSLECNGLSGIVGFGGNYSGALVFQCSRELARSLTEQMLGPEAAADEASLKDAIGEIANVVAGGMKQKLCATENLFDLSIPTIVEGNPHQVAAMGKGLWTVVRYGTEKESFAVAARLIKN